MQRSLAAVALMAMLAGCTTTPASELVWAPPITSDFQQTRMMLEECDVEGRQAGNMRVSDVFSAALFGGAVTGNNMARRQQTAYSACLQRNQFTPVVLTRAQADEWRAIPPGQERDAYLQAHAQRLRASTAQNAPIDTNIAATLEAPVDPQIVPVSTTPSPEGNETTPAADTQETSGPSGP